MARKKAVKLAKGYLIAYNDGSGDKTENNGRKDLSIIADDPGEAVSKFISYTGLSATVIVLVSDTATWAVV